jgi:hypothetical protein
VLDLHRGRIGAGGKVNIIKQFRSKYGQRYGSIVYCFRIGQAEPCHEKQVTVAWWVALTPVTRCLSISSILPGIQGDLRKQWLGGKGERDAKWRPK